MPEEQSSAAYHAESAVPGTADEQECSPNQDPRNAEQRRYEHPVAGLRLDLHRPKIDGSFARGVRETAVRKSSNPGKNQNYSGDFHRASGYTTICSMERAGSVTEVIDVEPRKIRNGLDGSD